MKKSSCEKEIRSLMARVCDCRNSSTNLCKPISQKILDEYNSGKLVSAQVFSEYITYTLKFSNYNHGSYYHSYNCTVHGADDIKPVLLALLKHYSLNEDIMTQYLAIPTYDECFKGTKFSYNVIKSLIIGRLANTEYDNCTLIDIIFSQIDMTPKNIELLCSIPSEYASRLLSNIIDKYDGDITLGSLDNALSNMPHTRSVVDSMYDRGLKISDKSFDNVCDIGNIEAIQYILEKTGIPITRNHFNKLLNCSYNVQTKSWRKADKNKAQEQTALGKEERVNKLVELGYVPAYEDVIEAAKLNIEIYNIDKYGIVCDQALLDICNSNKFNPKGYVFPTIGQDMFQLQHLCTTKKGAEVKKYLNSKDIVPDSTCMENATLYNSGTVLYTHLINSGGVTNLKCVSNVVLNSSSAVFIKLVLKDFEKHNKKHIEELEAKIQELEKKLAEKS